MSDAKSLSELRDALMLANLILERVNADPDDDLAMLSRQFLRAVEREHRLMQLIQDIWDGYGRTADISVDCLERMEALVTPGTAPTEPPKLVDIDLDEYQ